jgi:hypothetical protein
MTDQSAGVLNQITENVERLRRKVETFVDSGAVPPPHA